MSTHGPQRTKDHYRIVCLPRRSWSESQLLAIHASVDPVVRKPGGEMSLFLLQAQALYELAHAPGLFINLPVGDGKSLIGFLAPIAAKSYKPILFVPASLLDKTELDIKRYSRDFRIPNYIQVMSYEKLSRPENIDFLKKYEPDLVICDECQFIRNEGAACSSRIHRAFRDIPHTKGVMMTGTPGESVLDYHHLFRYTLKSLSPMPLSRREATDWAKHLDRRETRSPPGALMDLCQPADHALAEPAREGFRRRLAETPGVLWSVGEDSYKAPLYVDFMHVPTPEFLMQQLEEMRTEMVTPNGVAIDSKLELYRHIAEMALGFFYYWDPPAPKPWKEARRRWAKVCRKILKSNRRDLDSPKWVTNAIDQGFYPEEIPCGEDDEMINPVEALTTWREIRPTYEHRNIPAWIDFFLIQHLQAYIAKAPPTIVWVNQVAFGEALASATGLPYYAQEGRDWKTKKSIEVDPGGTSIIASIHSNRRGRNLQDRWSHNLFVDPPPNQERLEQALGRTHRRHQKADSVSAVFVVTCLEHEFALQRAIAGAKVVKEKQGHVQKILKAQFLSGFTLPDVFTDTSLTLVEDDEDDDAESSNAIAATSHFNASLSYASQTASTHQLLGRIQ